MERELPTGEKGEQRHGDHGRASHIPELPGHCRTGEETEAQRGAQAAHGQTTAPGPLTLQVPASPGPGGPGHEGG